MSATAVAIPTPPLFDDSRLAIAGFLARCSGPTRTAYATDLRQYFSWCADQGLDVFAARRGHLELWARSMEERGLARATVGRWLSTVTRLLPLRRGRRPSGPFAGRVHPPAQDQHGFGHLGPRPHGAGSLHRLRGSGQPHRPRPGLPAGPARPAGVGGLLDRHRTWASSAATASSLCWARARSSPSSRFPRASPGRSTLPPANGGRARYSWPDRGCDSTATRRPGSCAGWPSRPGSTSTSPRTP